MNKPTFISLFAGCGGSSLGYKWAGFKELLAIDFNEHAVKTFKLNFDCPVWLRDIKIVTSKEIMNFCKIENGELDILDGSPPCQGFSSSGSRQVNDNRNDLFKEYVRLVNELQPKVFVMENVPGMAKGKMKGKFIEIIRTLKLLNYQVKCKQMNAKYYQVPQSRERLIFIGVRNDIGREPCYPVSSKKIITVKDALKNITPKTFNNDSIAILKRWGKIKFGKRGWKKTDGKLTHFNYVKVNPNKPVPTIMTSATFYHWKEKRMMSIEEVKAICSFPQSFKLNGTFSKQWARLGNSVMPKFMQAIAENIKVNILDQATLSK